MECASQAAQGVSSGAGYSAWTYHGFKGHAEVATIVKGAQQLDAVAPPLRIRS